MNSEGMACQPRGRWYIAVSSFGITQPLESHGAQDFFHSMQSTCHTLAPCTLLCHCTHHAYMIHHGSDVADAHVAPHCTAHAVGHATSTIASFARD